jgi:uncharacterized membrane protein
MNPGKLKAELRHDDRRFVRKRRGIATLSITAIGALGVVALYQLGVFTRLPELPIRGFDSGRVTGSDAAYAILDTPDAVLGIGSYAVTLALASMGGSDRARLRPLLPLALGAKVGFDVFQAGVHSVRQWTRHRAFCSWCLVAATASFAMLPLAIPEAQSALARAKEKARLQMAA